MEDHTYVLLGHRRRLWQGFALGLNRQGVGRQDFTGFVLAAEDAPHLALPLPALVHDGLVYPADGVLVPGEAHPLCAIGLAETLAGRRGVPYEVGKQRGAVAYGGGMELDGREYMWQVERPVPGLLALDPTGPAEVLATLTHPQRLRLLQALIAAPRTAAELQVVIASRSPGPLYHHLRDLLALGVVVQRERTYQIAARHVIPLLIALALAIDLGARRALT